uniref:Uncharacterized protein n=1 Tax=Anguilla anguilla TaxID=7936 RepID=A0A0E9UG62_ANGAN
MLSLNSVQSVHFRVHNSHPFIDFFSSTLSTHKLYLK